jgi:hypothetical protein
MDSGLVLRTPRNDKAIAIAYIADPGSG